MNLISVKKTSATIIKKDRITSGMVGEKVYFNFDEAWDNLTRIINFRNDEEEPGYDMYMLEDDYVTIPPENLEEPYRRLLVAVRGQNEDGTEVIPTIYVELEKSIPLGAHTSGEEPVPITPDVGAQILAAAQNAVKKASQSETYSVQAKTSAEKAKTSETNSKESETNSKASEEKAQRYAELAEQGAADHGWLWVEGDDNGILYLYSENVDNITMEDNEGRLVVVYG